MWEGVSDRTELQHIDPLSIGHNRRFFPVFVGCSTGSQGGPASLEYVPQSSILSLTRLIPNNNCSIRGLRAHSAGCWLSLPHLVSNWSDLQTDWIFCELSYIIVQRPPFSCGRHNFTLIQPVHGQGYNSDLPRSDAPVIYTGAFPILTARLGSRSIYNNCIPRSVSPILNHLTYFSRSQASSFPLTLSFLISLYFLPLNYPSCHLLYQFLPHFSCFSLSLCYLPNPSARAGYDTRSIFKRSLTGLNSEFSFS